MSYKATILSIDEDIMVEEGQTLLDAALRRGVDYPHSCKSGRCGVCKSRLVSGEVEHDTVRLILTLPENVRFLPGQFALLRMDGLLERSYSMSNRSSGSTLEFFVRLVPGGRAGHTSLLWRERGAGSLSSGAFRKFAKAIPQSPFSCGA